MEQRADYIKIAEDIRLAKKYSHLSTETVYRIVQWAGLRYKKPKEIEKNARKKLHQIYGAYFDQLDINAFDSMMPRLLEAKPENIKERCAEIMALHNSAQERLPILSTFYTKIFEVTGTPRRIIDLACGLNPFSYPWIHDVGEQILYLGYDIDLYTTSQMNRVFTQLGLPASVQYNDLFLSIPPHQKTDVVFLLKSLPCLEQQEKGISQKIISAIESDCMVISFPSKSLGGRDKGMVENYRSFLYKLISPTDFKITELLFNGETVYILQKNPV